jgi:hypothetical protein
VGFHVSDQRARLKPESMSRSGGQNRQVDSGNRPVNGGRNRREKPGRPKIIGRNACVLLDDFRSDNDIAGPKIRRQPSCEAVTDNSPTTITGGASNEIGKAGGVLFPRFSFKLPLDELGFQRQRGTDNRPAVLGARPGTSQKPRYRHIGKACKQGRTWVYAPLSGHAESLLIAQRGQ